MKIYDNIIDSNTLELVVRKIAYNGLNAAVAKTTFEMAQMIAYIISDNRKSQYIGVIEHGEETYPKLEGLLAKYFNSKNAKGTTYWFDKSRKSINTWLETYVTGTMENPNF